MNITVNGKPLEVSDSLTVHQLLEQFQLGLERIAVEHNRRILDAKEFATFILQEGDTLEIVRFVGGG
ncbi:sulfur carrier protein ThiS [Alicyclobacillus fastidiosus]|uniref:Sulfur carrier protein ThiS n=1 Tax=Alicyclobacillus fastidiosus TaxID=392011 RepID=A0ABV5AET0_9BACL|nr:sulfur carrier protein ThiS [Alicyclobacillus fastidiosus]WEH09515.1 sulfur carrier protein ThiS [Alicyclobacillus fastidiosus]